MPDQSKTKTWGTSMSNIWDLPKGLDGTALLAGVLQLWPLGHLLAGTPLLHWLQPLSETVGEELMTLHSCIFMPLKPAPNEQYCQAWLPPQGGAASSALLIASVCCACLKSRKLPRCIAFWSCRLSWVGSFRDCTFSIVQVQIWRPLLNSSNLLIIESLYCHTCLGSKLYFFLSHFLFHYRSL